MRIAETKKDTYEFKRDIIIGAENPRTGKVIAEKMIRCGRGAGSLTCGRVGSSPGAQHAVVPSAC